MGCRDGIWCLYFFLVVSKGGDGFLRGKYRVGGILENKGRKVDVSFLGFSIVRRSFFFW